LTGRQPFADGVEWAKGKSVLQQVEDLVQQLLQANPAERLVGLEVLNHPWMADSKVAKRRKRGPLQSSDSIYMSPSRLPNKGSSTQSLSEEAQAAAAGGDGGKVSLNAEEGKAEE
ncbi:CASK, partial [Symbiodinium sp. KB8]